MLDGGLDGAVVSGPDSWSADGRWIYFDAAPPDGPGRIYRADVARGLSEPLTPESLGARGPALSPDGTLIAFNVPHGDLWDLYAANADGSQAHRVLTEAFNQGWSSDGRLILARWMPVGVRGGLATIRPDGSGRQ